MKIIINLSTDGAAIQDSGPHEIKRILDKFVMEMCEEWVPDCGIGEFILMDYNGNTVGNAEIRP